MYCRECGTHLQTTDFECPRCHTLTTTPRKVIPTAPPALPTLFTSYTDDALDSIKWRPRHIHAIVALLAFACIWLVARDLFFRTEDPKPPSSPYVYKPPSSTLTPIPTPQVNSTSVNAPSPASQPSISSTRENMSGLAPLPTPSPTAKPEVPHFFRIIGDTFVLPPGYQKTNRFVVPPDSQRAHVIGEFTAVNGDNTQVHIFDQLGYENFVHRAAARSFYESGRVYSAKVDVWLAPGEYYLVFENSYSLFSTKTVSANITLIY